MLGGGTRLFPQDGVPATLRLTGAHTLDSGVATLTYVPAARTEQRNCPWPGGAGLSRVPGRVTVCKPGKVLPELREL